MRDSSTTSSLSSPSSVSPFSPGLWYCRECFVAQLISDMNNLAAEQDCEESTNEQEDEAVSFYRQHGGHHILPLAKKKDRCCTDRPAWDPFRTAYEEVTDGCDTFLLKSWRTNLHEPRTYALLRGALAITTTVQLPEEPLRQELVHEFSCSVQTADAIVNRLRRVVTTIPASELRSVYCSAEDPSLFFAHLDERLLRVLTQSCREADLTLDAAQVRNFFIQQQQEWLALELRQSCDVLLL